MNVEMMNDDKKGSHLREDVNKVVENIRSIIGFPISNAFFYFKNNISNKIFRNCFKIRNDMK